MKSVWLVLAILRLSAAQQCTMCVGGTPFDPNGRIGGATSCFAISQYINATAASDRVCLETQLQSYIGCGCETYPDIFCPMCEGAFVDITDPNKEIPLVGMTCQEALFVDKSSGKCTMIQQAAYFCGCPGATPSNCSSVPMGKAQPIRIAPCLRSLQRRVPPMKRPRRSYLPKIAPPFLRIIRSMLVPIVDAVVLRQLISVTFAVVASWIVLTPPPAWVRRSLPVKRLLTLLALLPMMTTVRL